MKKDIKKIKISIVINIIITIFAIVAFILRLKGIKFMPGNELIVETTGLGLFRIFTIDSNLFMGIVSLIFAIQEFKLLNNKIKSISKRMYIYKLMATVSVTLTFVVVFVYLGPNSNYLELLKNSNLFFHLLIPLLSIITFTLFEKSEKLNFKDTLFSLVPVGLYAIFYFTNILVHMENGKVSPVYDWYWFVQRGVWTILIVVPIVFGVTYGISLLLWKLNRRN